MSLGEYQRAFVPALLKQGYTINEAIAILNKAKDGDQEAQGIVENAKVAFVDLPYVPIERPRLLEEGLPIPPDYLFLYAIAHLMKNNPKMLENLADKWLDSQTKIINALAQSGAGNIVTAYSHSFLIALMLEQNYLIRQRGSDDLIASLNWLTAAQEISSILGNFNVPEVLTYSMTGVYPGPTRKIRETKKPKVTTNRPS